MGLLSNSTAAAYLRVSTDEQSTANQLAELVELARRRELELVVRYEDTASGAAYTRRAFRDMMRAAKERRWRTLLLWSLDRLGRSMAGNLSTVLELDALGVEVLSVREPWLEMRGPVRDLLVAIFSWVAQQEREQLIARTNAGLARARAKGVRLGRPSRASYATLERARVLLASGTSIRKAARAVGVPESTLRAWRKEHAT